MLLCKAVVFAKATASVLQQTAGESDLFGAQAAPRLLASFCWREERPPAFPASPDSRPANLHQELLLGFDVCQGFDHSVLSMVVEKIAPREGQGPGWSAVLQVQMVADAKREICL